MGRGGGCFNIVEDRLFDIMAREGGGGGGGGACKSKGLRACSREYGICV